MSTSIAAQSYTTEIELLRNALRGDKEAANKALKYLSSANPHLCGIMQEAIHEIKDDKIWSRLLICFALHLWDDHLDCERRTDPGSSERIDQAIIEVFVDDRNGWEKPQKQSTLQTSLTHSRPKIRYAAAYLLGLRGDSQSIPVLAEAIESPYAEWKLRAAKALAHLKDERCGPPLLKLLIEDRGELHREASRALNSLGSIARSTWQKALNHPNRHIRWHAARGLGEMGDSSLALILAEGLRDDDYAVRWATADVLSILGEEGIRATLNMLSRYPLNEQFRRAAYHALHGSSYARAQERLKPLLDSMRGSASNLETAIIAQKLLMEREEGK
ncbi:hypothetical protein GWN42_17215 [candidate division KSB1 bacterium]|nr:hypothetical protein [Phycisphaerae bacterium]NIV94477.1 hypothetical protein [candidate division KSB1 bacterium]